MCAGSGPRTKNETLVSAHGDSSANRNKQPQKAQHKIFLQMKH